MWVVYNCGFVGRAAPPLGNKYSISGCAPCSRKVVLRAKSASPVILMIVKEASYPSLERRCLLQITDGAGAVEELPLELRGNCIPAHKHGRAQTLQNLLFFVGKGSTVVVILSPLNRLIDIYCHPF